MSRSHNMNNLRETLQSLENTEIPARFLPSSSNDNGTENASKKAAADASPQLLQRYKGARDEYLRRRIEQAFCSHVASFDGENFELPADAPSREEQDALQQRSKEVKEQVLAAASQIQTNLVVLKTKYANFTAQREELQGVLQEMEASGRTLDNDNDDDGEDNIIDPVDDEFFAQQEERLVTLQQRKAELQTELARVQQENSRMQKATNEGKEQLERLQSETNSDSNEQHVVIPETVAEIKLENEEMKQQVERMKEISLFYSSLTSVMEELGGIKVLSVDEASADAVEDLVLTVRVLQEHEIQIGLKQGDHTDNRHHHHDSLRLVRANFTTCTLVQACAQDRDSVNVDQNAHAAPLEMHIPDLADLVRLAENLAPGDDLRFFLRETVARITVTKARLAELTLLKTEALTKIGKSYHTPHSFGGEDQDIVCSLNEQITVVLRLTPDCPLKAGSVYMDQLVGCGGWKRETVQEITERIQAQQFSSPVALLRAVKAEISRLADAGMALPKTPTMPVRRQA